MTATREPRAHARVSPVQVLPEPGGPMRASLSRAFRFVAFRNAIVCWDTERPPKGGNSKRIYEGREFCEVALQSLFCSLAVIPQLVFRNRCPFLRAPQLLLEFFVIIFTTRSVGTAARAEVMKPPPATGKKTEPVCPRRFLVALLAQRHGTVNGVLAPRSDSVDVKIPPEFVPVFPCRHAAFGAAVSVSFTDFFLNCDFVHAQYLRFFTEKFQ